jgi:hypothetical protein
VFTSSTDWCAPIDAYCERTDAGFWSEPINALSNAGFLIAAFLALRLWLAARRSHGPDGPALFLIAVTAIVGVGSFLFHTFANRWSLVADVLPIAVFIYAYFALAMRRYLGLPAWAAGAVTLLFAVLNWNFVKLWKALFGVGGIDITNGSVGYFPAALAMMAVGLVLLMRAYGESRPVPRPGDPAGTRTPPGAAVEARWMAGQALLVAALVFAISLLFRSIDLAVCSWLRVGTHFLWHALNAVVLYVLVRAAIRYRAAAGVR